MDLQYILLSSGSNHSFNSIPPLAPWDLPSLIPLPFPNPLPLLLPFRWFPLSHGHTYYQPSEHAATAIFGKATVESYPKEIFEPRKNSLGFFLFSLLNIAALLRYLFINAAKMSQKFRRNVQLWRFCFIWLGFG